MTRVEFTRAGAACFVDAGDGAIVVYDATSRVLTLKGPEINCSYDDVTRVEVAVS